MKKHFAILAFGLLANITNSTDANAQMPYKVTVQNQAYTPLAGAVNINSTIPWLDTTNFTTPLGFRFKLGDDTISNLNLLGVNVMGSDTAGTVSGMSFMGTSLTDRGHAVGSSKSPIRYNVSGPAGKRIFKLEYLNAGFADENSNYGTLDDSLNMQVWLREDSNIIEMRFGPSKISHYADYFFFGGPLLGYIKNMNRDSATFEKAYMLKGSATSPTIDSVSGLTSMLPSLSAYPGSGTVYRFIPKNQPTSTYTNDIQQTTGIRAYPTLCSDKLFVENQEQAGSYQVISLAGRVIQSGEIKNGLNTVDVGMLPGGMYIMTVKNELIQSSHRFIKQ